MNTGNLLSSITTTSSSGIGGLSDQKQQKSSSEQNDPNKKVWDLNPETELRIEVDHDQKVTLKLIQGTAEIFGTEIAQNADYVFTGRKFAIYSWKGCSIEIYGAPSVAYIAEDTPMYMYLNAHLALQQKRIKAKQENGEGPNVMIVGPADVGKTSICKILVNYCVKQGGKPLFIDLDSTEGSITIPGTLSATSISRLIDAEEDLGSTPLTTNTTPIAFYYGYSSPLDKPKFYSTLIQRLADVTTQKKAVDPETKSSGVIINTPCQFVEGPNGMALLKKVVEALKVDVIFVISHERLYSDLNRQYPEEGNSGVAVVKLNKSGGVVNRDQSFRKAVQSQKIREYFYGNPNTALGRADLNPYSTTINYHDVAIHRVGEGFLAPSSALPLGEDRKVDETHMVTVNPGNILLHSLLAVSDADIGLSAPGADGSSGAVSTDDVSKTLISSNVAGFIYIASVDDVKKKITILSPSPGKLPRKHLIMGALKWMEMS